MAKRKTKKQVEDELEERRQQIEALKVEAKSYGVYVTSDRLSEVSRVVNQIRREREGKPPCYWTSYERSAKECRICDLVHDCARGETVPEEIPVEELQPVPCRRCGSGMLNDPQIDKATGIVRDYCCSSRECLGSLVEQSQWVEGEGVPAARKPRVKSVARKRRRVVVERSGPAKATLAELADDIIGIVRDTPGCNTRDLMGALRGGAIRKHQAIKDLVGSGQLRRTREAHGGYRYWLPED